MLASNCYRFVMTKIHELAFGGILDGAVDIAISNRLRVLQSMPANVIEMPHHAQDCTAVLTMAGVRFINDVEIMSCGVLQMDVE